MNKQEAIKYLEQHKYPDTCGQKSLEESNEAIDMAIEALSAERTGEWEYEPSNGVDRCSVCGTGFRNGFCIRNVEAFNFCPNCGAKMGGDTK